MGGDMLAERIGKLEDVEAIKKWKYRYCYAADDGDVEGWLALFTDGAILDFGFGRFEGRAELRRFIAEVVPAVCSFTRHHATDPVIEVNGNSATGKWYVWCPASAKTSDEAMWIGGTYEEEYVRRDGEWKCSLLRFKASFFTPYDQGWVKDPFGLLPAL